MPPLRGRAHQCEVRMIRIYLEHRIMYDADTNSNITRYLVVKTVNTIDPAVGKMLEETEVKELCGLAEWQVEIK